MSIEVDTSVRSGNLIRGIHDGAKKRCWKKSLNIRSISSNGEEYFCRPPAGSLFPPAAATSFFSFAMAWSSFVELFPIRKRG